MCFKLNPNDPENHFTLGMIYLDRLNNLELSEKYLKEAVRLNDDFIEAYSSLAVLEDRRGNKFAAKNLCEKVIEKAPNYALAHYSLFMLYFLSFQDLQNAGKHYQIVINLEPSYCSDFYDRLFL